MGCGGEKHGCMWVAVEQRIYFCGLIMYESWIYEKSFKKISFS
jgi:hypothetical protein